MGVGFDILEYCRKLRSEKEPPYICPIEECVKSYQSMCGLRYHLVHFNHDVEFMKDENGRDDNKTPRAPRRSKKLRRKGKLSRTRKGLEGSSTSTPRKERVPLTYSEAQKFVEFEIDDDIYRVPINECIQLISKHNYEVKHGVLSNYHLDSALPKDTSSAKLPEAKYSIIDDYPNLPAFEKPAGYIRFIEKSPEDLDSHVEYDMDEEDAAWLEIVNGKRGEQGFPPVTVDTFELLMDRLEKESYFQMKTNNKLEEAALIDEDAVCCICMDGECQNSNVILFCDMCNLAVHQDCYGVPYIPEGQWLCRRCLQSPSRAVDCILCPNNAGAFKQTDRGHWAHVVCALWIPEVRFANTVFLEPIDSVETIPPARWKLTCYLCKQKGVGACIQCHKTNCYLAFHVTCAQNSGLYMKIDAVKDNKNSKFYNYRKLINELGGDPGAVLVQKIAFCSTHTPADAENRPNKIPLNNSPLRNKLAKTSCPPVISIPTIPPERIQEIGSLICIAKKSQFIQRLIAYWTLKRQLRNGVPLLRRLQTTNVSKKDYHSSAKGQDDIADLRKQLKYWQCLRQDLERARLLCELVRKREKLKRELVKVKSLCLELELCPLVSFLRRLLDLIRARDTGEIFIEPVDQSEVPDYSEVVKNPMDLSTMRDKIETFQYNNLQEFEADFYLMINNCLAYNAKETVFYRAAVKMRDQGGALLKQAQKDLQILGIQVESVLESSDFINLNREPKPDEEKEENHDTSSSDIDAELVNLTGQNSMAHKDVLRKLNSLLGLAKGMKVGEARSKRIKLIKTLITKVKRTRKKSDLTETPVTEINTKRTDSPKEVQEAKETKEVKEENVIKHEKRTRRKENSKEEEKKESSTSPFTRRSALLPRKSTADKSTADKSVADKSPQTSPILKRSRGRPSKQSIASLVAVNKNSDSFTTYRSSDITTVKSDDESHSDDGSSCSACNSTDSRSGSSASGTEWSDSEDSSVNNSSMEALDQLQLVWAKCRGYPWYPALIINPKMPRGYVHNGVAIPSPPADVIALANNYTEPVYLVLFFDTKRTWQWLPRNKLEPLGITNELDSVKLTESRKPTDRKAVKKAYEEALSHRVQSDKTPTILKDS